MKKYVLGLFAIIVAVGLSSYTQSGTTAEDFSWFDNNGVFQGTSHSLDDNLLGCPNVGLGCGRVYRGSVSTEPGTSDPSFIQSYRIN